MVSISNWVKQSRYVQDLGGALGRSLIASHRTRRDGIHCCGGGLGGDFRRVNGKSLSFDFSNCSGGCLRRVDGKSLPSDCPGLVGDVLFFLAIFVFVNRSFPSTFFFLGSHYSFVAWIR